jgi:hypothetical protein
MSAHSPTPGPGSAAHRCAAPEGRSLHVAHAHVPQSLPHRENKACARECLSLSLQGRMMRSSCNLTAAGTLTRRLSHAVPGVSGAGGASPGHYVPAQAQAMSH